MATQNRQIEPGTLPRGGTRRLGQGRLEIEAKGLPRPLDTPAEIHSFSGNPFGVAAILPMLVGVFVLLAGALALSLDLLPTLGGFLVASMGLMLIPAVTLRGRLTIGGDGFTFDHGKKRVWGTWENIVGLQYEPSSGICLKIEGANQSPEKFSAPGGLVAKGGTALIPLRLFGDRRFAILYMVRDRLSSTIWRGALEEAQEPTRGHAIAVYALVTAIAVAVVVAVALIAP